MNLTLIKNTVTSKAGLAVLASKTHSPAILFGAGVVGIVGTIVLSSRATLKLGDVLDEFEEKKELSNNAKVAGRIKDETHKSNTVILHSRLVRDIAKLYAPSVILGIASVGALGGSHYILTKRNAQLTAALTAVTKAFQEYRGRVKSEFGEEKDYEFMYGVDSREVLSQKKNGEDKVTQVKTFGHGLSPYAKLFDEENINWQDTPEYCAWFLRLRQNYLNDRLRTKGHVFLNDAYRELGMEDTEAGAVTGWTWDGDTFIDFGVWTDDTLDGIKDFMRNKNGAIMVDFNVEGPIFKKLGRKF